MLEEKPEQLPVSPQETQIQAPSFWEKIQAHKKKILIGLGLFLSVLILAGAAFGVYKYAQNQILPNPSGGPTPEVATPTPDPTTGWETYTNTECRYSIKYPASLTPVDKTKLWFAGEGESGVLFEGANISVLVTGDPWDVFKSTITADFKGEMLEINIAGEKAFVLEGKDLGEGGEFPVKKCLIRYNDKNYQLVLSGEPDFDNYLNTFNLMLSTFKFLDQNQTDGTENWEAYSNEKYGFAIKYPSDWVVEERTHGILFSEGGPAGDNIALRAPEKDIYNSDFLLEIYRISDIQETSVMDYFKFAHKGDPIDIKSSKVVTIGPNKEEFIKIEESTGGYIGYIKIINQNYYEISYFNPRVQSLDTDIGQILSTFRFD